MRLSFSGTVRFVGLTRRPGWSSSVAVTSRFAVTPSYSPPLAACRSVTISFVELSSFAARAATVCAAFQFDAVNVRRVRSTVMPAPSPVIATATLPAFGGTASATV